MKFVIDEGRKEYSVIECHSHIGWIVKELDGVWCFYPDDGECFTCFQLAAITDKISWLNVRDI